MADVPQAQDLCISFEYWRYTARLHEGSEPYPVLNVKYSYQKVSQYTPHHSEDMGLHQPQWAITVQPVSATLKHRLKELLQREALPKLHAWLFAKQSLTGQQETQILTVWYDSAKDELRYGEHRHL